MINWDSTVSITFIFSFWCTYWSLVIPWLLIISSVILLNWLCGCFVASFLDYSFCSLVIGSNLSFCACRGYKRFFKRSALETSDYLKDDCLLVNCTVGVVQSHTEGPKIYTIPVPPSNMAQHIGQLLTCGKRTDITFEVDGEMFPAHKVILSARSPVFRAQLFGPMKDKNMKCIKIEDMEAPVFKVPLWLPVSLCYIFFVPPIFFCFIALYLVKKAHAHCYGQHI